MKTRHKIEENDEALSLGMILLDQLLFGQFFFKSDLSMEMTIPQKAMFCDNSKRILLCTSRNVGKTISLRARILRDLVTYLPSQLEEKLDKKEEILIVTPAQVHLTPLIERLYMDIDQQPFAKSLVIDRRRGDSPSLSTKTGLTIYGRIEGIAGDDRNMQGIHPRLVFSDETQYSNSLNHRSRLAGAMPDCKWVYAGVPNGVRSTPFYRLDTTKEGARNWSRHKFSMLTGNPRFLVDRKYRKEIEREYGGKDAPEYITQIKGEWGDEAAGSFPSGVVKWGTHNVYISKNTYMTLQEHFANNTLPAAIRVPQAQCYRAVIGADYGLSPDPATLTIAVQYEEKAPWQTYARISLYQVPVDKQIMVLKYLWTSVLNYRCTMVSVDSPEFYQMLLSDDNRYLFEGHCKETKQGASTEVDIVTNRVITPETEHYVDVEQHRKDKKVIKMGRKHFLTHMWKAYMSNSILEAKTEPRFEMGYDAELESEMLATVEQRTEYHVVYSVPKINKVAQDQICDSIRAVIDCIVELENTMIEEVFDYSEMVSAMGWTKRGVASGASRYQEPEAWRSPWQ